jgi:hypothetical protein
MWISPEEYAKKYRIDQGLDRSQSVPDNLFARRRQWILITLPTVMPLKMT